MKLSHSINHHPTLPIDVVYNNKEETTRNGYFPAPLPYSIIPHRTLSIDVMCDNHEEIIRNEEF